MAALSPLFPDAVEPSARAAIQRLAERSWSDETYLAGTTALALYLNHRPGRSLDLMSSTNRLAGPDRRDLLFDLLEMDPATRVETARDGYLYVRLGDGVALRIFYYPYPMADPFEEVDGLEVASALDLGLMKLGAIISRGTRRDFADLYLLARKVPLDELLERSEDKFGHVRDFPLQALKGLADLTLTEGEAMPKLREALEWDTVASWVRVEVARLGRERLGLAEDPSRKTEAAHE